MSDAAEIEVIAGRPSLRYWRDLWEYREIFWYLSWRDVLVRYKQTAIGVAWSVLRPLLNMAAFTLVFGSLARLPSDGVPYALFVFAGMLPWQFFANTLTESGNSLILNANLLTKVYFPRLLIPASVLLVSLLELFISLLLFFALALWYGVRPDWRLVTLPIFFLLAAAHAFGFGVLFSALNVRYQDFRYVIPFAVQLGLYLSPVGFGSGLVPEAWRGLYRWNPLVGVIDGFRWSLLAGRSPLDPRSLLSSSAVALVVVLVAARYFRATERVLADVV